MAFFPASFTLLRTLLKNGIISWEGSSYFSSAISFWQRGHSAQLYFMAASSPPRCIYGAGNIFEVSFIISSITVYTFPTEAHSIISTLFPNSMGVADLCSHLNSGKAESMAQVCPGISISGITVTLRISAYLMISLSSSLV